MDTLPDRAHPNYLRKQAKDLLRLFRTGDPGALARFARFLPAAAGRTDGEVARLDLRLHDARSCVARQYGFPSWSELLLHVEARALARGDQAAAVRRWLTLAYGGDVTGSLAAARPHVAARMLREAPGLADDVWVACAAGHLDRVSRAVEADPAWVNRPGGPLNLPPLVAVTHSRLGGLPDVRERLRGLAAPGRRRPGRAHLQPFPTRVARSTRRTRAVVRPLRRCRGHPRSGPRRAAARRRGRPE